MLEIGQRDLSRQALASAESTLRRAKTITDCVEHTHVTDDGTDDVRLDIDEVLSEVLVQQGRPDDAATVIDSLRTSSEQADGSSLRRANAHLRMARAWTVAARWADAAHHADLAARTDPTTNPAVTVIRAHIALGRGAFDHAERLAYRLIDDPDTPSSPELTCEAHEILGRLHRRSNLDTAEQHFHQLVQTAEQHRLPVWRARGLHELATIDLFNSLRTDHARQASADADALGANALTAHADYHLACIHCSAWRVPDRACTATAGRTDQPSPPASPPRHDFDHAGRGRRSTRESRDHRPPLRRGHHPRPHDPHVAAAAHNAHATHYLMIEDHPSALRELGAAAEKLRHADLTTTSAPPLGRYGPDRPPSTTNPKPCQPS